MRKGPLTTRVAAIVASFALLGALALVPGGVAVGTPEAEAACEGSTKQPREIGKRKARKAVVCLLNKQRARRGLGKLSRNRSAERAARDHTRLMIDRRCFSHQCPGESDLVGRLVGADYLPCGCTWGAGENIAWGEGGRGSARSIVKAWMNSPGHRANILDRSFEHIGVGLSWGSPYDRRGKAATYTTVFGYRD